MATTERIVTPELASSSMAPKMLRYLALVALPIGALIVFTLVGFGQVAPTTDRYNLFGQIALNGDLNWYRDFVGGRVPEIQDQELFYHNIGGSVAAARQADIVILGPSFSTYAFDRDALYKFGAKHGLKMYNMSFLGIRGGEFSLRIAERWKIRPKLWIINIDDQFIHFFSRTLDETSGPQIKSVPATQHGRLRGFINVVGQNLRWRAKEWLYGAETGGLFRNINNGDVLLDTNPRYLAIDNKEVEFDLGRECHASQETMDIARDYVRRIGGQVIFTLVPHSQACQQQARELANALDVELIVPPFTVFTTVDGGGHLDKKGAVKFSSYFFSSLLQSKAFDKIKYRSVAIDANQLVR